MEHLYRNRIRGLVAALAAAALLPSCATYDELPEDIALDETAAEESAPLGGETLLQRKQDLERALSDLAQFHATFDTLAHRGDRNGLILFSHFVNAYLGRHVDPMLKSEWQSRHPELMALDAGLRFAKGDLLVQMREPRRVQRVMDELRERYTGRESMLVDYPIGSQGTLGEGLEHLANRKWQG